MRTANNRSRSITQALRSDVWDCAVFIVGYEECGRTIIRPLMTKHPWPCFTPSAFPKFTASLRLGNGVTYESVKVCLRTCGKRGKVSVTPKNHAGKLLIGSKPHMKLDLSIVPPGPVGSDSAIQLYNHRGCKR